jgi:hypothetical protein
MGFEITPLVATVFLIALGVAIGVTAMNIGVHYSQSLSVDRSEACQNVELRIHDADGPQVFINYGENTVSFILNNEGTAIDNIQVDVITKDNLISTALLPDSAVEKAKLFQSKINLGSSKSAVKQLRFVPGIKDALCSRKAAVHNVK